MLEIYMPFFNRSKWLQIISVYDSWNIRDVTLYMPVCIYPFPGNRLAQYYVSGVKGRQMLSLNIALYNYSLV